MSFRRQFVFHVLAALAAGDEPHAEEDEDHGQGVGWLEDAYAREHAHHHSHHRLDVIIHADHRGAQGLLGIHREYIADVGADKDHECSLKPCRCGDVGEVNGSDMLECEWQNV